jgi:hypothetical protein
MLIEDSQTHRLKDATFDQKRAILAHTEQYPKCDGSMVVDNHKRTMFAGKSVLWCAHCEVTVHPV